MAEKSKESRNTGIPENNANPKQDWKVLNVGIFSIQMTDGPHEAAGGSHAKSGSKAALLLSRTTPFSQQSNTNNASVGVL